MKRRKIVLAAGSGFIGNYMSSYWCKDNEVVVLTRKKKGPSTIITGIVENNSWVCGM